MAKLYQGISKIKKIDPLELDWLTFAETRELVDALGAENMRYVGGAVRDSLLGLPVSDIDVAVTLPPETVIERLKFAKIKVIPTGLDHGTVTAIVDQQSYEVTTLRNDVKTHGRRADVAFTDSWEEDAKRRDFTFNALYLDEDGNIYDYFDGLSDLENGHVRFIGDANTRIEEDGLRILRYFRFLARFGIENTSGDSKGLDAAVAQAKLLTFLSGERIREELKKLLLGKDCTDVLQLMVEKGVWRYILPNFDVEPLRRLVAVEQHLGKVDIYLRLVRVMPKRMSDIREASKQIKLSNAEMAHLMGLLHPDPRVTPDISEKDLRETAYRYGLDGLRSFAILNASVEQGDELREFLSKLEGYQPPKFPIMGRDLIDMGIEAGPAMGEMLAVLEERWIESGFFISRDDLLEMVKTPQLH
jgi:poly(A) polymerase